ncbi:MAG: glycoside hydrolase family 97 N-terminal domain-containing protein [Acidobacteriia bacterium]|nr:glycoside hydrolase family 97 N-terminal domain-containing protein [Terriglobia bacterium]
MIRGARASALPPPFWAAFLFCAALAPAQDLRSVVSPNGQLEFRAFIVPPSPGEPDRLAYQVLYEGKPLLDASFISFEIREQAPLGDKLGLMSAKTVVSKLYRSLGAEYMQNGTTGRRLSLEVRAYDEGVAFRVVIPRSSPLEEIFLQNEDTEFRFTADLEAFPALTPEFDKPAKTEGPVKLSRISSDELIAAPLVAHETGGPWVSISQTHSSVYPPLFLNHSDGTTLITALPPLPKDPKLALDTTTPLVCPWRLVLVGSSRESVTDWRILGDLPL